MSITVFKYSTSSEYHQKDLYKIKSHFHVIWQEAKQMLLMTTSDFTNHRQLPPNSIKYRQDMFYFACCKVIATRFGLTDLLWLWAIQYFTLSTLGTFFLLFWGSAITTASPCTLTAGPKWHFQAHLSCFAVDTAPHVQHPDYLMLLGRPFLFLWQVSSYSFYFSFYFRLFKCVV